MLSSPLVVLISVAAASRAAKTPAEPTRKSVPPFPATHRWMAGAQRKAAS